MQFEINVKPRKVTIETRTFKGKWIKHSEVQFEGPALPEEIYSNLMDANRYGYGARAISSKGNQLMTTRAGSYFYEVLDGANLISVIHKSENQLPHLYSNNNKYFPDYKGLHQYFIDHKGIDYTTEWSETDADGNLTCFGIKMNDGEKITLAAYY